MLWLPDLLTLGSHFTLSQSILSLWAVGSDLLHSFELI